MPFCIFFFVDRVAAVGIHHETKGLVETDKLVDQMFGTLEVNVIVGSAMD
jgi:hypothetical protein